MKIVIVDYDTGNVNSIKNMLKRVGYSSEISSDINVIEQADKLIFPGVGSFDYGMQNLLNFNLKQVLDKKVLVEKTPILGICLGMQLMGTRSEEGSLPGLGWLQFEAKKFNFSQVQQNSVFKTPHMGWSEVKPVNTISLFNDIEIPHRYYFVHSYHFFETLQNKTEIMTTTNYGYDFVSGVHKENIYGVQFHPEKSHKFGMQLLKNFIQLN